MDVQGQPMPETAAPQQAPEKKGSKRTIIVCSIIAILLILGGAAIWFFYMAQKNAENERTDYEILENNYDTADYENFLEQYPNSEHAAEVAERLARLKSMAAAWATIDLSGSKTDFVSFKNRYHDERYDRMCDMKIDSLDWVEAGRIGTERSYQFYLSLHPDGRYATDAAIAAGTIRGSKPDLAEREQIAETLNSFFSGFGENDEESYCPYIAPILTQFLQKKNATKADVVQIIGDMFNEHITGCTFILNGDYDITKVQTMEGDDTYHVAFSVDQRIERDNEGKTFGSYTATAELNAQFMITALTMKEVSRK